MTKTCNKCGENKDTSFFYKHKTGRLGVDGRCKPCRVGDVVDYQKRNPEKTKQHKRNTYTRNSRKYKDRAIAYAKIKYANDPEFKVTQTLRTRLRLALKGTCKADTTKSLLGCTYEEARAHIEAQFTEGMSWDKMGVHGIHIDHIRPCASFDLTDPEQQRECFHYTNLQPLWAKDNLRKSDKW